jgi:hypothetical protein
MLESERALCRKHATACVALARITTGSERQLLLTRAEERLKLASSGGDAGHERVVSAFSEEQLSPGAGVHRRSSERGRVSS